MFAHALDVQVAGKSPARPDLLPAERRPLLLTLNGALALLHLGLAMTTLVLGNWSITADLHDVSPSFVITPAPNASQNATFEILPGAPTRVGGINLTFLVAAFFAVTALAHALPVASEAYRDKVYFYGLSRGVSPARWGEYFVSASIMFFLIHYFTGTTEVKHLLGATSLLATTITFGLLSELINESTSADAWPEKPAWERWSAHAAGTFSYLVAWGLVLGPALPALEQAPDFVTWIVLSQVGFYSSFWVVPIWQLNRPPSRFSDGELAYMALSALGKTVLGVLVLANVLWRDSFDEAFAP